jgi:hypothetical protein
MLPTDLYSREHGSLPQAGSSQVWEAAHGLLGNRSCVALPPASLQSCPPRHLCILAQWQPCCRHSRLAELAGTGVVVQKLLTPNQGNPPSRRNEWPKRHGPVALQFTRAHQYQAYRGPNY